MRFDRAAHKIAVDMMDNASALPTCPQPQQRKQLLEIGPKLPTRLHEEAIKDISNRNVASKVCATPQFTGVGRAKTIRKSDLSANDEQRGIIEKIVIISSPNYVVVLIRHSDRIDTLCHIPISQSARKDEDAIEATI